MSIKRNILLGACCLLLVTFGCKNEVAEPLSTEALTELQPKTTPLDIALEASVEPTIEEIDFDESEAEEARNLNYGVTKSQKNGKDVFKVERKGLEEKPLYSLCVIKPKTGANASNTYYVRLTWQKKKGQNYFFVKEKSITETTGKTIKLAKNTRWHICGILTYNKDNVRATNVAFDPNKTAGTALSGTIAKDIPLYFDWQDLGVDDVGAWRFNPENTAPAKITVKPLGVMLRVSVQNNAAFKMRLKTLKLQSNGLIAGAGYVGWGGTETPLNKHIREVYKANNPDSREEVFTLSNNVDVEAGKTYDKFFLVWVFPKDLRGATTEKKYTKVMVSAKRLDGTTEKTYPIMTSLYGFWSTTNDLKVGKRHHLPVTLYRPKMALEYLSDGYAQGPTSTSFNVSTGWWPTALEYSRYRAPSGYRKLKFNDVRGIMTTSQRVKFSLRTTYEETFSPVGEQAKNIAHIGGVPIDRPYKFTYKNGDPSIFALRFDDGEGPGKRLHYSAYEYEAGNPGQIKAVYLGPNFKGTIADVNAAFINSHSEGNTYDVVKKVFAKASSFSTNRRLVRKHANLMVTHMVPYHLNYTVFYSDYSDDDTRVLGYGDNMQRNQDERKAPVVLMETGHGFSNR